jgi:uncharacterized YigZ family protein
MTSDIFLTISEPASGIYKEKSSKFLAFAYPVISEAEIRALLQNTRKEYYDARHVCYAYILGSKQNTYNASDGGEPAHTAGDPILNEIRSIGLTNILVIVVRYFGGTKLGKSGLIAAYKQSAKDALQNCTVIEKVDTQTLTIEFDYTETNQVQSLIQELGADITGQQYEIRCRLELSIPKTKLDKALEKLEGFLKN